MSDSGDRPFRATPEEVPVYTPKDPARFASLIDDVEAGLFGTLPDDTWVYPGHGNDTTIGAERPHLAEWRARGW